ncbi:hypothetical protein ACWC9U_10495 [Streptomyces sp. 900116325]
MSASTTTPRECTRAASRAATDTWSSAGGSPPVPVGSRVRLHASVVGVTEVARGGVQMTRAFAFELEGSEKPACVAESLTHFYP